MGVSPDPMAHCQIYSENNLGVVLKASPTILKLPLVSDSKS
jgi:hypothetical protein